MNETETAAATDQVVLRVFGARVGEVFLVRDAQGRYKLPKGVHITTTTRTKPQVTRMSRRGKDSVDFKLEGAQPYATSAVAARLIGLLGNNAVAQLLGVAKDRPGRWARGQGVEAANRAALADLESLVGQLLAAFTPAQAALWLAGDNAHLGARPIDAFRLHGSAPVIEAIAAREQGAFA